MKTTAIAAISCSVALLVGCKASVRADAKVGASDRQVFDEPIEPQDATAQRAEFEDEDRGLALLGARHDLSFNGNVTPKCECLAVALGQSTNPSFAWATGQPRTNVETQLVVAVAATQCADAPENSLGASYWGYETVGSDIIVVVETAREGRPITAGGIIPKPLGDGMVYVKPAKKSVPYGRPLSKEDKLCKLGNPGASTENDDGSDDAQRDSRVRIGGETDKTAPSDHSPLE